MNDDIKTVRDALEYLIAVCEICGDFKNGVTDPTGSIDEGEVRAAEAINGARQALTALGRVEAAGWQPSERFRVLLEASRIDATVRFQRDDYFNETELAIAATNQLRKILRQIEEAQSMLPPTAPISGTAEGE